MTSKLFLLFSLDEQRFACSTESINEIIPLVHLTPVPKTAPYIAGLLNYRGTTIPVIDAVMLLYDKPARHRICTRVIIASSDIGNLPTNVGLIVESASRTVSFNSVQISEHTLARQHSAYLGKTVQDEQGEIQLLDIESLIPREASCLRAAVGHA